MFDKKWFLKNQKLIRWFANTNYGRGVLGHDLDKVDLILPNAVFQKLGNKYKAEFRTHNKYSKRLFYTYKPVWKAFHWFDMNMANVYVPKLNLGFDTLTAYPAAGTNAPIDGRVLRGSVNETFSTIRAGAGTGTADSDASAAFARLEASATTDQYGGLVRSILCFDTSSLGDTATISAAVFSLKGSAKNNALGATSIDIVASTPASTSSLTNSDYGQLGTTVFASIAYASYSTSAYNDFTLDANGRANIDKTTSNNTKFGGRVAWDTSNSFGGTWASSARSGFDGNYADATGTSTDPKLVVTYTVPAGFFAIL